MRMQPWQRPSTLSATRPPITWVPPALPQRTTPCDRKWATAGNTLSKSLSNSPMMSSRCASSNFENHQEQREQQREARADKAAAAVAPPPPGLLHDLLSL